MGNHKILQIKSCSDNILFMNPSRVTNADIDTDYGSKDREKVKRFILKDHMNLPNIKASEIITFNTIALKGAIKDVGRALGMDLDETQSISDSVYLDGETKQWTVSDSVRRKYPKLFKYVDIVNGTVVSIGSHPSGILVSDLNIDEEVGLCSLSTSEYPVSQLNMKELDALMYVKLDILGLDNVSVINETCRMAGIERLTPDNTDLDDEKVWNDIRDDTTLIFQWESESAQAFLRQFMSDETIKIAKENNENFSYIKWFSFGNGLIRPGCASFRDSVAKGEILTTGFKELDSFLSVTSGRITMQEDIMRFLVLFCGYSDAESDTVRRGIAKKYGTEKFIDEIHDRFISYSHEKYNVEIDLLEEIFPPIKQGILDATRYAFSWNHSDAYSCIGYICGYLRYYYPLEFVTAALNTFEDKEDKSIAIIEYAKKRGIKISPIKFRHSVAQYNLDKAGNQVFKGISSIKYMNEIVANEMYELRGNTYNSFIDLLIDLQNKTSLNSRQLQILIELDFFEEFGDCNKLLETVRLFDELYGKKQMKKEKCEKLGIPEEVVLRHCGKATEKTFMELDLAGLLTELCDNIKCKPRKLKDKVAAQVEHLGYVDIADPSYDRMLAILDVDTKYAPKIKAHSLKNGTTLDIKVDRRTFNKLKIAKGDIILVRNQNIKPKQKKNSDGEWEPVPGTKEIWLTDYRKVDSL